MVRVNHKRALQLAWQQPVWSCVEQLLICECHKHVLSGMLLCNLQLLSQKPLIKCLAVISCLGMQELAYPDGKVEQIFLDGRRTVVFGNGTRKHQFPDGHTAIRFTNRDIKRFYPCGKGVTLLLPISEQDPVLRPRESVCLRVSVCSRKMHLYTTHNQGLVIRKGFRVLSVSASTASAATLHAPSLLDSPSQVSMLMQGVWSTTTARWTLGIQHMLVELRSSTSPMARRKHTTHLAPRRSYLLMVSSGECSQMGGSKTSLLNSCHPLSSTQCLRTQTERPDLPHVSVTCKDAGGSGIAFLRVPCIFQSKAETLGSVTGCVMQCRN